VCLTLTGLIFVSLITIGIGLIMMMTVQQRRERMNRQINERLKILIAAYKTLGGRSRGR
jgi:transposase